MSNDHASRFILLLSLAIGCGGGAGTDGGLTGTDADGLTDSGRGGSCGNGVVEDGEDCDDGNANAFDGCEPDVCTFTCDAPADCDDGIACNGVEICSESSHVCEDAADLEDGMACTLAAGSGVCRNGECVEAGCGNELIEDGESCDDGNTTARDGCENDCRFTCEVDPSMPNTWYLDCDGDGYAAQDPDPREQCLEPPADSCGGGWTLRLPVTGASDCDDTSVSVYPGATELCDLIDNNCAAGVDEGLGSTFYADNDNDMHGNAGASTTACTLPAGYVASSDDCNDADATSFPGGAEVCDGGDNDCDGTPDDGVLNTYYADSDSDGHGNSTVTMQACTMPGGHVTNNDDCNDADPNNFPTNPEVCDTRDNDCDALADDGVLIRFYRDFDGDGFGDAATSIEACAAPTGYVASSTDCCDSDGRAHPYTNPAAAPYESTARIGCGGFDFNCDGAASKENNTCTAACTFYTTEGDPAGCAANQAGWTSGCTGTIIRTAPACGTTNGWTFGCAWSVSQNQCINAGTCLPGPCPTMMIQRCR